MDYTAPLSAELNRDAAPASDYLRGFWYYAACARNVRKGQVCHRTLLGEPVLVGRDNDGTVFALRDTCPHRGTLLSRGTFNGDEVECPYHGWRFKTDGQCVAIPSQLPDQRPQPQDIKATVYTVEESQGNIWIYMGSQHGAHPDPKMAAPTVPAVGDRFQLHLCKTFDCTIDLAITGLMDPAHGAFVHASSVWRGHRDVRKKEKAFSPAPMGWRMDRHLASGNARAYRLFLGGAPETQIIYSLPGVRIEHATTKHFTYCGLTACTPVDEKTTAVHHVMYWDVPGGAALRALVRLFAGRFIGQDAAAVEDMRDGLAYGPDTMLVQDADAQIRWYYRLKTEWQRAQTEGRPFENPITPSMLRWRS